MHFVVRLVVRWYGVVGLVQSLVRGLVRGLVGWLGAGCGGWLRGLVAGWVEGRVLLHAVRQGPGKDLVQTKAQATMAGRPWPQLP